MNFAYKEQGDHIMSWRQQWTLNNPVRGWFHPPRKLFAGLVEPGMTVLDTGCGTGFFSLALARMVGDDGRVIAVDVQPEALALLEQKADALGLSRRIETWHCEPDDLGKLPKTDFALSFYMAHETPYIVRYFERMAQSLRVGGKMLLAEPKFHVSKGNFDKEVSAAIREGFELEGVPQIFFSHAALLKRS